MDQAEHDPTGRSAHEPGSKLDAGKRRPALVLGGFANALDAVTAVGTYGAKKYTDNGWRTVPNGIERYTEAMLRHWLKEVKGELHDPETELLHAAHLAWNALARLELMAEAHKNNERGEVISRVAQRVRSLSEWRNDRLPTKEDAGPDMGVWVWNYKPDRPWRFVYNAVEDGQPWVNGNALRPTCPPAFTHTPTEG